MAEFDELASAMRSEFNGHAEQKGSAGGTGRSCPAVSPARQALCIHVRQAAVSHRIVTVQTLISIRYRDK